MEERQNRPCPWGWAAQLGHMALVFQEPLASSPMEYHRVEAKTLSPTPGGQGAAAAAHAGFRLLVEQRVLLH